MILQLKLMHPLVQERIFMTSLRMSMKLLQKIQFFGSTLIGGEMEGGFIKIPYSYLPQNSNYLKLI